MAEADMFNWRMAVVAAAAALSMGAAQAGYILDTGPGLAASTQLALNNQGVSYQNLGVTFNVGQNSSLSSVEGWITGAGSLLFELHQGASPTGALLFSSLVAINDTASNWHGATGLDWDVLAGDYTLTVIAQPGFSGGMETAPANPAGTEWFATPLTPNWATMTFNLGWRVGVADATVPEPSSFALAALGLLALSAGAARRRQA
jgi:hypothetical protein